MPAEVVHANSDIIFSKKALFPLRDYRVHAPREAVLRSWMEEVEPLRNLFSRQYSPKNLEEYLLKIHKHSFLHVDPQKITHLIFNLQRWGNFNEESTTLLAIGSYILHKKPRWKKVQASMRVIAGGDYYLETFPTEETINCIDVAAWIRVLADGYRLKGDIVTTWDHSHYQTDSGRVLDPMTRPDTAGFFPNISQYEQYCADY